MKSSFLIATLAILPVAGFALEAPEPTALSPEETVQESVRALRNNDILGLIEINASPQQIATIRQGWEAQRTRTATESERREFAKAVAFLADESAEERLMGMVRPKLDELRPQWSMMVAMFTGMAQSTVEMDETTSPEEREQALKVIAGITKVLQNNDFTNEESARQVIGIFCDAVRGMEITSVEDVQSLDFEQLMERAGRLVGATKSALGVYGFEVDAWLDTIEVVTLFANDTNAKLRISFEMLGTEQVMDAEMVKVDGRWVGKSSLQQQVPMGF